MSGRELAAQMRAADTELRVLFMSAHADDVITRDGIRERRLAFLEKPFTRQTLLERVRTTLDGGTGGAT
jgi:FixJ family two-component response regulator